MDNPLSDGDLHRMMPGIPVLKYSALRNIQSLSDMPDKCFILLEWKKNSGHWVCFNKNTREYFNSLGEKFDCDVDSLTKSARIILGEDGDQFNRLLGTIPCTWNSTKYQNDDSSTCGKHCIMRLQFGSTPAKYKKFMNQLKEEYGSYDDAVLALIK